ncbi:MAG: hypothetical protein AAGD92_14670 [Pseudomonadota bacterium]
MTSFKDDVSVIAAVTSERKQDERGFYWEEPVVLELQIFARDDFELKGDSISLVVDGKDALNMSFEPTKRSAKVAVYSRFSVFRKRRPYYGNEDKLARIDLSIPLNVISPKRIEIQPPDIFLNERFVTPPRLVFNRKPGIGGGKEVCNEF